MRTVSEMLWLDARDVLTLPELAEACAVQAAELQEMVDDGVLRPVQQDQPMWVFSAEYVMPLRKADRLRRAFDLDLFTVGLLTEHLLCIEALEAQVLALRARLGRGH